MGSKREVAASAHPDSAYLLEQARALGPLIRGAREETDRLQRTPPRVVRALCEAGLFRLWMPRALGGHEADPMTHYRVITEVAEADGSAGWNLMNGANCSLMAFYLPEHISRQIFSPADAIVAGQIAPNGKAVAVDGGYRVGGRWSFGSGIHQATWLVSGCIVFDGEKMRTAPNGMPQVIHVMTPPNDVTLDEDSWHVSGLRGTGSCDYSMDSVFVPEERSFSFFVSRRYYPGPLSLLSRTSFAMAISAVSIGIARAAVQALVELAATKKAPGSPLLLRDLPHVQGAVAQASGLVTAAEALVERTTNEVWQSLLVGAAPAIDQQMRLRAASVLAPRLCAEAVDIVWKAGGAASIREAYVIERCFRDVHATTQHLGVGEPMLIDAGRALLGLEPQILPL